MAKMQYPHLMVDLETMGSEPGSAIVSIAAVQFDIETGETGRELSLGVDLDSCTRAGLTMTADVVEWWMRQEEGARQYFVGRKRYPIDRVLKAFTEHFPAMGIMQVWGNGPRFDFGILAGAYRALGMPVPWDHRLERCVRTMLWLRPDEKNLADFVGTKHDPLADCKHQIAYVSAAYRKVQGF